MHLQAALSDHGSMTRLEAIARLEAHANQDPRITATLSHLAENDNDPHMQVLLPRFSNNWSKNWLGLVSALVRQPGVETPGYHQQPLWG